MDLRVSVARIETAVGFQTESLRKIERTLEVAVFRTEFDTYKAANDTKVTKLIDDVDRLQRVRDIDQGAQDQRGKDDARWRWIFLSVVAVAGALSGYVAFFGSAHPIVTFHP